MCNPRVSIGFYTVILTYCDNSMQRSPTNTGECKGEIFFSFSFFSFNNTAIQQAVEWLLCRNILILSFSGFKQTELTIGCLKAEIKEKISGQLFMLFVLIFGRIEARVLPIKETESI